MVVREKNPPDGNVGLFPQGGLDEARVRRRDQRIDEKNAVIPGHRDAVRAVARRNPVSAERPRPDAFAEGILFEARMVHGEIVVDSDILRRE